MAEIITKDSDEFKELAGWIKRIGRSLEDATARMRPAIADEHYLQGEDDANCCMSPKEPCRRCVTKGRYLIRPSEGRYSTPKARCMRHYGKTTGTTGNTPDNRL